MCHCLSLRQSMKGCFIYFVKWSSPKFQLMSVLSSKYNEKKEKIGKNTFFLWWGLRFYSPHNFLIYNTTGLGFSGGKESDFQGRRPGFDLWVAKVPWRKEWQPPAVFLPEKSQGQRSLVGYNPWGRKRVRRDLGTKKQTKNPGLTKQQIPWLKSHFHGKRQTTEASDVFFIPLGS